MRTTMRLSVISCLAVAAGTACLGSAEPSGPRLAVDIAALTLTGPDNVCYDLRVENNDGVVWSKGNPLLTLLGADQTGGGAGGAADTDTVCSTQYGNSAGGDVTYIGTCDASSDSDTVRAGVQNRVTLWVDGIYKSGADLGDWQDPCESGCALSVDCEANEDSLVEFNLTLMRQANQGFFDVAVNFQDIFCSAKFDTCYEDGADAGSEDDKITLIHGADQVRDWTGVVGFACSAGNDATQTNLLYGPFTVTCGSNVFAIDPSVGEGNSSVAGTTGGLLHYGVYRGTEQLDCGNGAGSCKKLYWNVAFSIQDLEALGGSCTLAVTATANDNNEGFALGLPTAIGVTYPYIDIATTLTTDGVGICQRNELNVTGSAVLTHYRGNLDGVTAPTAMCKQFNGSTAGGTGGCAEVCSGGQVPDPTGGCRDPFCGDGFLSVGEECDTSVPGSLPWAVINGISGPALNWCASQGPNACTCQNSYPPNGLGGCGTCGDGIVSGPETCESPTPDAYSSGCGICVCDPGTMPNPDSALLGCVPVPYVDYCGNGVLGPRSSHNSSQEQCDSSVSGAGGDPSDCQDCECAGGTGPDGVGGCVNRCGDGIQDPGEDCDGGLNCETNCTCVSPWVDHFFNNGCYCDGGPADCGG